MHTRKIHIDKISARMYTHIVLSVNIGEFSVQLHAQFVNKEVFTMALM